MTEIELINFLEHIEERMAGSDSPTQQRLLLRIITRMRTNLDDLYDREYAQRIHANPSLVGKIFPQLSGTGRVVKAA